MANPPALMANLQEKVKERIQASFMDLIPVELWDGLVAEEVRKFTAEILPEMIRTEAKAAAYKHIQKGFQGPEWAQLWDTMGLQPSPMVLEIVKAAAPELVAQLFGRVTADLVNYMRNNTPRF